MQKKYRAHSLAPIGANDSCLASEVLSGMNVYPPCGRQVCMASMDYPGELQSPHATLIFATLQSS